MVLPRLIIMPQASARRGINWPRTRNVATLRVRGPYILPPANRNYPIQRRPIFNPYRLIVSRVVVRVVHLLLRVVRRDLGLQVRHQA